MNVQGPQFGYQYSYYHREDAHSKRDQLKKEGIDSLIEPRFFKGLRNFINYVVHTNEEGTNDLTCFRKRVGMKRDD